jgi:hypothetical protein
VRRADLLSIALASFVSVSFALDEPARADEVSPLVVATPEPAHVAEPPPRPAPSASHPTRSHKRWYGWQVLIVHGVADTLATAGLIATFAGKEGAGFGMATVAPVLRGLGSYFVESAHDNRGAPAYAIMSFLGPLLGGAAIGVSLSGDRKVAPGEDVEPYFARGWAAGMLVGGSLATAIEASVTFDDARSPVALEVSPSFVGVRGAF